MNKSLIDNYTLIIPTFNRAEKLARLLKYLNSFNTTFKIIILDSSNLNQRNKNSKIIQSLNLHIKYITFPQDINPFEKFYKGSLNVTTPFCSLCADDDLIVVKSIKKIIKFLEKNKSHSAAHGFYFSFHEKNVHDIVYSRNVLNKKNIFTRLRNLFDSYEALTYSIYRTDVLQDIFMQSRSLKTILLKELVGSALTTIKGKVARLPIIYYGRHVGESSSYTNWHPIESLLTNPDSLYTDYNVYRNILYKNIKTQYKTEQKKLYNAFQIIDLFHFLYMNEFFSKKIIHHLSDELIKNSSHEKIMKSFWPLLSLENEKNIDHYLRFLLKKSQLVIKHLNTVTVNLLISIKNKLLNINKKILSFTVKIFNKFKSYFSSISYYTILNNFLKLVNKYTKIYSFIKLVIKYARIYSFIKLVIIKYARIYSFIKLSKKIINTITYKFKILFSRDSLNIPKDEACNFSNSFLNKLTELKIKKHKTIHIINDCLNTFFSH